MNEEPNKLDKFFKDPDWILVENMIQKYLEPLGEISRIDTKRSNDEIATELKARQMVIEELEKFLRDSRLLGKTINNKPISFK